MITLKSIAIKTTTRAPMQERDSAEITIDKGITGDFRGSAKDRQITILSESAWQKACNWLRSNLDHKTNQFTGKRYRI
jgi:hypothetical protein